MGERVVRLLGGLGVRLSLDLVQDPTQEVVLRGVRVRVPRLAAQLLAQAEGEERVRGDALVTKTAEVVAEALHRELAASERAEAAEAKVKALEAELAEEHRSRDRLFEEAVKCGVEASRLDLELVGDDELGWGGGQVGHA